MDNGTTAEIKIHDGTGTHLKCFDEDGNHRFDVNLFASPDWADVDVIINNEKYRGMFVSWVNGKEVHRKILMDASVFAVDIREKETEDGNA